MFAKTKLFQALVPVTTNTFMDGMVDLR